MKFRQLNEKDAKEFSSLIVDMYGDLENEEWFSPMPYDEESVKTMIENPRFFILGAEEDGRLCAVSSLDFKCGKLVGQNVLPEYCTLENTVEIGFTMVRSDCKGRGIMKQLVAELEKQASRIGKKYVFGKVHIDNLASYKSFVRCGFEEYTRYDKSVKREEFQSFISSGLLKPTTLAKAKESLNKNVGDISVKYAILIKNL